MDDKKFGVITEQGYVGGQFGYTPLSEQDNKTVNDNDKKKDEDDE